MDRQQLYDELARRKFKPKDLEPYDGNNGRVNKCAKLFRDGTLRKGGCLVDVGGGIGDLGYCVRDLFDTTVVVDISRKNLDAAEVKGNDIALLDVDGVGLKGFDDASSDVVTALDFIEHIVDPENFARECFRVLKPGGHVFINTPNIQFWRHIEQLIFDETFPHTSGDREVFHGGHLAFFTYKDLVNIFGGAGFGGFVQVMDEEGYVDPSAWVTKLRSPPSSQAEYVEFSKRFGCSNLLFKCEKP